MGCCRSGVRCAPHLTARPRACPSGPLLTLPLFRVPIIFLQLMLKPSFFVLSPSHVPQLQSNTVDSTIMAESSTDPITIPAAEGQPHEADPPIPSWGSGTAPSTPMVDDEEGLVSPMQGSIRRKWEMLIDTVQSDTDSAIDGMSAVFVRRGTTSSSLIL